MASAKAGPRQTTRKVTLRLTEGEADMLLGVLGQVGGNISSSPRKYAQRVYDALVAALGYRVEDTDAFHLSLGHIEFFDYKNHPLITTGERIRAVLEAPSFQLHASFDPKFGDSLGALRAHVAMREPVGEALIYLDYLDADAPVTVDPNGLSE